jgi:excisionase family DNA binding protein
MEEKLLSVTEAAELLGVSPSSLRRWTAEGRLGVLRLPGGARRYERAELERFKESWRQDVER